MALSPACDARVNTGTPPGVDMNTTIVNSPTKEKQKAETTTVTSPGATGEKKTTETTK